MAIWSLRPNYAWAQQVPKDDKLTSRPKSLLISFAAGRHRHRGVHLVHPVQKTEEKRPGVLVCA